MSAFFRRTPQASAFKVPPSDPYIEELQRCWANPSSLSHQTSDGRAMVAIHNSENYGLECMPAVEPSMAAIKISLGEALRPNTHCPRPQCRSMDDYLIKCYETAAHMGCIGNTLFHLMLGLSQSLQLPTVNPSTQSTFSDTSLQSFAS